MTENHTIFYPSGVNNGYFSPEENPRTLINVILLCVLPFEIIVGVLANIWAITIIIKRRLWLQHEGYVYLCAILITNALVLVLHYVSIWFWCVNESYSITRKTNFLCKVWSFFFSGFYCTGLLVLALLFDVCLRNRRAQKEGETQTSNGRPLRCSLIVALTLIILTLLFNTWKLVSFELHRYFDDGPITTNEYFCGPGGDWRWVSDGFSTATIFLHGVPIVIIIPVLFALIACSGCNCTRCTYGTDSCEHFPRRTLLSLAGIVCLQFPVSYFQLFASPSLLFTTFAYYKWISEIFCATIIVNGLIFAVVPILCIVTMPRFREATFKAGCCSCGQSGTLEIEAIALRETGQEN